MNAVEVPTLAAYTRLSPRYDRAHRRWLGLAGGPGQWAFEAALAASVRPGMAVLDAGCGTGALARHLLSAVCPGIRMTLVDACVPMLVRAADVPAERVEARLEALPFEDARFDLVACAWALETTARPERTVAELMRVLRPGGSLCLVFCAAVPAGPLARLACWLVRLRGAGRLLEPEAVAGWAVGAGAGEIRRLRCTGPAAVLMVRKDDPAAAGSIQSSPALRSPST